MVQTNAAAFRAEGRLCVLGLGEEAVVVPGRPRYVTFVIFLLTLLVVAPITVIVAWAGAEQVYARLALVILGFLFAVLVAAAAAVFVGPYITTLTPWRYRLNQLLARASTPRPPQERKTVIPVTDLLTRRAPTRIDVTSLFQ